MRSLREPAVQLSKTLPRSPVSYIFLMSSAHSANESCTCPENIKSMWPSMVTHTRNLCSTFHPSKHTHTHTHTHTHAHTEQWAAILLQRTCIMNQHYFYRLTYTQNYTNTYFIQVFKIPPKKSEIGFLIH